MSTKTKAPPRPTVDVPLHLGEPITLSDKPTPQERAAATDRALLAVCAAHKRLDGDGEGDYAADQIIYVRHHGLDVPGHIIFDGTRYRTSRVPTYATLEEAVVQLCRAN